MFDNKYPYTDFHELNLDWFMGEFKKLVAEWEETKGEWNTLHDYVQNYFENLNVQTEIDNKINAMILDGTFADIVSPFVTAALPALVAGQLPDVVAAQISAVVAAQISAVVAAQLPSIAAAAAAAEVGDWLAAHIDPDTGYVIDDTLTVSDAAADAKVVGDRLSAVAVIPDYYNYGWSNTSYNGTATTKRISNVFGKNQITKYNKITAPAGFKVAISAQKHIGDTNWYVWTGTAWATLNIAWESEIDISSIDFSLYDKVRIAIENNDNTQDVALTVGDDVIFGYNSKYLLMNFDEFGSWEADYVNVVSNAVRIDTNQYIHHKTLTVKAGDIIKFKVTINTSAFLYVLTDSNNVVIENVMGKTTSSSEYLLNIQTDGTLYINSFQYQTATIEKNNGYVESSNLVDDIDMIQNGNATHDILILGDSQTQRTGYPERLISKLQGNYKVYHYGQGGADSIAVANMYGSIPVYVDPVTIPATTTAVEITLKNNVKDSMGAFSLQSQQGDNPCSIAGVKGNLSVTYDAGFTNVKYFFTRSESGTAVTITRPVLLQTNASTLKNNILVVWVGTNDSAAGFDVVELAKCLEDVIDTMILQNDSSKYIVMGLTSKAYMQDYADVNKLLARKYGVHFLDLASYILQYGLDDAGITPTAQDVTDIANGEMPNSLRADEVHFNSAGYTVIGDLLYNTGVELGYWI